MFKRFALFFLINILIVVTLSAVLSILGVQPYLSAYGINYVALAQFCLVWGMGGAFISLAISRMMAKWTMGIQVIDPQNAGQNAWLVNAVHQLAKRAELPAMPEVGIYESPEVNAFATGPTKSRSLVAVSTGLLHAMDRAEIEGVLAHEVAHIQNGDMVTMTLLQGVVNAFIMFIARVISFFVSQSVREESRHTVQFFVTMFAEIALGFLGMIVLGYFSRAREFKADAGSAKLAGRENMIKALQALQRIHGMQPAEAAASLAPYKIDGKASRGTNPFATHPPLEDRIEALRTFA